MYNLVAPLCHLISLCIKHTWKIKLKYFSCISGTNVPQTSYVKVNIIFLVFETRVQQEDKEQCNKNHGKIRLI